MAEVIHQRGPITAQHASTRHYLVSGHDSWAADAQRHGRGKNTLTHTEPQRRKTRNKNTGKETQEAGKSKVQVVLRKVADGSLRLLASVNSYLQIINAIFNVNAVTR